MGTTQIEYRCSNCHQPTTPILCSVGVSGDCCEEAEVLVIAEPDCTDANARLITSTALYRPLTAFEEDELKRLLFDDLPRASQKAIARGETS